jgi:hypothetical protein
MSNPNESAPRPRVVIPTTSRREIIFGVLIAVVILGGVLFAILHTGGPARGNHLRGEIIEKIATGIKERDLTFTKGRMESKTTDSGYHFKVKVKDRAEPYIVPVEKELWDARQVGESFDFLRPPSEQKY